MTPGLTGSGAFDHEAIAADGTIGHGRALTFPVDQQPRDRSPVDSRSMSAVCGSPLNAIPHTRTRVRSGARPFAAASEDTCSATNCGIESLRQRAASSSSASTASASATPASILVSFLRQDPPTPGPGIAMGLRGYPVLASAMVAGISRPSPDMTLAAMFANAKETSRTAVTQASDRPATSWGSRRSSWTPAPCRARSAPSTGAQPGSRPQAPSPPVRRLFSGRRGSVCRRPRPVWRRQ